MNDDVINKDQIHKLSQLVRINMTDLEENAMAKDMGKILDYVKKLQEVDVEENDKNKHLLVKNVLREDVVTNTDIDTKSLIEMSEETQDGFVKVKNMF